MFYEFLSDISEMSIEWDGCYGKHWVTYASVEAMDEAIRKNEEYNNLPEVSAVIEADANHSAIEMAKYDLNEYLDYASESTHKLQYSAVLSYVNGWSGRNVAVQKLVAKTVCDWNKQIIKMKFVPKCATNTIGDFLLA